jgi:hypothetical protein
MAPVQSLPVDAGSASVVLAVLLFLLVAGYVLVTYGRRPVALALLAGLALVFVGQQLAFTRLLGPYFEGIGPETLALASSVQFAFQVGFLAELLIITVELLVEDGLGDDRPLRELSDGLFDALAFLVVAAIVAALVVAGLDSAVVLSTFTVLLAVKLVEAVVNTAVALAQG